MTNLQTFTTYKLFGYDKPTVNYEIQTWVRITHKQTHTPNLKRFQWPHYISWRYRNGKQGSHKQHQGWFWVYYDDHNLLVAIVVPQSQSVDCDRDI